jgi:hypothetical protein
MSNPTIPTDVMKAVAALEVATRYAGTSFSTGIGVRQAVSGRNLARERLFEAIARHMPDGCEGCEGCEKIGTGACSGCSRHYADLYWPDKYTRETNNE